MLDFPVSHMNKFIQTESDVFLLHTFSVFSKDPLSRLFACKWFPMDVSPGLKNCFVSSYLNTTIYHTSFYSPSVFRRNPFLASVAASSQLLYRYMSLSSPQQKLNPCCTSNLVTEILVF